MHRAEVIPTVAVITAAIILMTIAMLAVLPANTVSFHGGNLTCAFAVVKIENGTFTPNTVSVFRNATVVWQNPGPVEHAINVEDDLSSPILPGESYTRNFHTLGTFDYYCRFHPGERGTVIVR